MARSEALYPVSSALEQVASNQPTEAKVGCNVLNQMTGFDMPVSSRIRRHASRVGGNTTAGLFGLKSVPQSASAIRGSTEVLGMTWNAFIDAAVIVGWLNNLAQQKTGEQKQVNADLKADWLPRNESTRHG
jgi:hypothetical protein